MKINNECARKILLEVEKIPFGENISVVKLHEKLNEFELEDMLNIITIFNKEYYLSMVDKVSYDNSDVFRDNKIKCLTEKGYRILDLIRDDDSWNLMKSKIDNFDDISIFTIFDIANKINNVKYNDIFDLPRDIIIYNSRL